AYICSQTAKPDKTRKQLGVLTGLDTQEFALGFLRSRRSVRVPCPSSRRICNPIHQLSSADLLFPHQLHSFQDSLQATFSDCGLMRLDFTLRQQLLRYLPELPPK